MVEIQVLYVCGGEAGGFSVELVGTHDPDFISFVLCKL